MKKITIILMLLIFSIPPVHAQAIQFDGFEEWDVVMLYHRGDVIRYGFDLYISVVPSKGVLPDNEGRRWKKVDYNNHRPFQEKKIFPIGAVVVHEGRYFISRGINVALNSSHLEWGRRWLEFAHPGLIHDLPPEPDDQELVRTLIGIDANNNGIRDDYERAIAFSDLPLDVKDAALSAGRVYGALILTAEGGAETDLQGGEEILHQLVVAHQCRLLMLELYEGRAWQESLYFDTMDRIEAKFKLQKTLAETLGEGGYGRPHEKEPCVALAAF